MDQGVIESFKRRYRKAFIQGLISETDADLKQYWKMFTIKDAIYIATGAWNSIPAETLNKSWYKLLPTGNTAMDQKENRTPNISSIKQTFSYLPGFEDISENDISNWLDMDKQDKPMIMKIVMTYLIIRKVALAMGKLRIW
ncbi:unnamed protein product [Acanthoscelides obtectus]|uniref:DDE-1 domain-containing protein n=1 Tax=Acanthoscelides obtectus TaxID=200917 RepID=A0A9P0VPD0_ACAOB|nr:unnamed protein product [Acanthoscelides obtectus]CAK1622582.1 Jerky protein homolog-like [Acanthoscelides obtectus]